MSKISADYHRCADCEHCVRATTKTFKPILLMVDYICIKKRFYLGDIKYFNKCKYYTRLWWKFWR